MSARNNDQRYISLVENLSIGIVVHDNSSKILFANRIASELLGIERNKLSGIPATEKAWHFIFEDGRTMPSKDYPVNQVIASKKAVKNLVIGIVHQQVEEVTWVYCNAYPEFAYGDTIEQIVVNFTDISKEMKLRYELQMAKNEAENASRIKSRFISVAAHELKNPVSSLVLMSQMMEKKFRRGIPIDLPTIETIASQSLRFSLMITNLLDVSRIEKNVIVLDFRQKDIIKTIHECLRDFQLRSPARVFKMISPIDKLEIKIDNTRIYQVISNLLDNADKYSPEKGIIQLNVEVTTNSLILSVTDEGQKISEELKAQLFKPLSKENEDLSDKSGGLGLGLYICRSIIELHGGKIGITHPNQEGNTFFFEIPLDH
jgi:signal transduction histidine kinase